MRALAMMVGLVGLVPAALAEMPAAVAAPPAVSAAPPAAIAPDAAAWQDVITGQIEAFRKGDAPAAFGYAAAAFQKNFPDAMTFMTLIAASGYTPIFTSVSHSFGKFDRPDDVTVVQEVKFVGAKQDLYEAIYLLGKEAQGWKVQGVQLMKIDGLGV
jgi:hypothetical protein